MNSPRERASQKKLSRLRDRFRSETQAAVLAAAEEVFAETGLAAAMGAIARRAGVAVGTLYNHFADRETLLSALLDLRRRELLEEVDARLREVSRASFVDQLVALVSALFSHLDSHRGLVMVLAAEERVGQGARSHDLARELYARIDKLIQRGVKEGVLREQGSDLFAASLLGLVRGMILRERYGAPSTPMLDCVGRVVDFFLHGARQPLSRFGRP
jgi:AcrR family transcriptional regulator